MESDFRRLLATTDLPSPRFNQDLLGAERDAVWPRSRLVVELDSRRHHLNGAAFEDDRRRDAELQLAGWRVVRFTHAQVTDDPAYVVGVLERLLSAQPPGRPRTT